MTRPHKLFTALVVQGALLGGCFEEEESTDPPGTDPDPSGDTGTSQDTGSSDDTALTGACAEAECLNTDVWQECTADGVLCCWAAGECCDPCCGHLSP